MKLTAQEEYGLRCMIQLARSGSAGFLTITEIARKEGLSSAYVAKLMRILRRAGLARSIRGQKGGYELARGADQVSLHEIVRALGGRLFSESFCGRHSGSDADCVHAGDCSVRSVWSEIEGLLERILSQCMLSDLLQSERKMGELIQIQSQRAQSALGR